ncbi:hypothetical protein EGK14_01680 [Erwinia sp. 198]|nr:hypothetical protein EGK14_01680 [Erwinia sp. 198]
MGVSFLETVVREKILIFICKSKKTPLIVSLTGYLKVNISKSYFTTLLGMIGLFFIQNLT